MFDYLLIPLFVILFLIAIFDIKTATIPHTLTIALFLMGILYCIFDKNFDAKLTLVAFFAILISQIIFFCTLGEDAIGGGDVKILSISMLFLHSALDLYYYCFTLSVVSVLAVLISKVHKQTHVRFGPYMAISLLVGVFWNVGFIYSINLVLLMVFLLSVISTFLKYVKKESITDVYKDYKAEDD